MVTVYAGVLIFFKIESTRFALKDRVREKQMMGSFACKQGEFLNTLSVRVFDLALSLTLSLAHTYLQRQLKSARWHTILDSIFPQNMTVVDFQKTDLS